MGKKTNYVLAVEGNEKKIFEQDDFRLDTLNVIPGKYRKDKQLKEKYGAKAIGVYETESGEIYVIYTTHKAELIN